MESEAFEKEGFITGALTTAEPSVPSKEAKKQ